MPGVAGYQVRRMQTAGSEAGRKFYDHLLGTRITSVPDSVLRQSTRIFVLL